MEKVLELGVDVNIEPLYRYLQSQRIPIKVSEESGKQIIWVNDASLRPMVLEAAKRYLQDTQLQGQVQDWFQGRQVATPSLLARLAGYPTIVCLLISLLITAVWTGFGEFDSHRYFLFLDRYAFPFPLMASPMEGIRFLFQEGDYWRLIAPAWLHWGVMHWLFNSLGVWVFGRSLERYMGVFGLLTLVFVTALISNVSQFFASGPGFAGFSGVVYAMIGVHAAGMILAPKKGIWVHQSLVVLSVLWMFAGIFGVFDLFGLHLANMAHFMGFVCGVVAAGLMLIFKKR
ncbi:rhomboid family intramembrane serine protease [Hahella ganghwensis]|uniref:rhomboid family intramembrane serine protease n=1 Tax=Hahella ganghwensis TaxID=286420 RepID=UPI000370818B|nr:rhomboid family intramembrane serine protease [Hahella ganghwensis]